MANTLLTTSRTLQATNNPQDNISQANNTQNVAEQPINSNVNGTQGIIHHSKDNIKIIQVIQVHIHLELEKAV